MITLDETLIEQLCNAGYYRDYIVDNDIVETLLRGLNGDED